MNMLRFFGLLLVVVLVCVGLGWYLDWFHMSSSATTSTVELDKAKAKADIKAVENKAEQVAEKVKSKVQASTTDSGTVAAVDASTRMLTLTTANDRKIAIEIRDDSVIRVGGKPGRITDLLPNQAATCVHKVEDGKNVCVSLTVNPVAAGSSGE
jgi:hypothetical protein